jgi:DnaK suppressor protein
MNKRLKTKLTKQLKGLEAEILDRLSQEEEEYESLMDHDGAGDAVDIAEEQNDRETIIALSRHDRAKLQRIHNALARMSMSNYGACLKCGGKIDQDRLLAMPDAVLCVRCKAKSERPQAV